MRILILNWRCPRNPHAGGAELMTYEVARRLVRQGNAVEWFSASFAGAPETEDLDGIHIVRLGRQWTVHWHAFLRYRHRLAQDFDVVVDEVNTIPFFTPLWSRIPCVMFIHQLAREVWWYESAFPISAIGYLSEPTYLRCYRRTPIITVSESTRRDLRSLGLTGEITIAPEGLEALRPAASGSTDRACFLYVGRLSPSKRIDHLVEALQIFYKTTGTGTLWLAGDGRAAYVRSLRNLANRLGIGDRVMFFGRVTAEHKHELMSNADSLLMASVREGWGLVVSEANACGTPAIAYDVPGLRDSVIHETTGLIVKQQPRSMAEAMVRLCEDRVLRARLSQNGRQMTESLSFDNSTRAFATVLNGAALN